jgi:ribosomal protein S18 acetylase RimI-like enzyme
MSASAIAQVVNWAYRGKYVEGDARAWTGERHLLAGVRTTAADIASLVQRTNAAGSREVMLLALSDDGGQPTPGLPLKPPTMALLGTVHVQCLGVHPPACEAGMFSVDPDRQSAGVGGQLLAAAEQAAVDLGARSVVLHVLEGRDELQDWYERCGYAVVPSAPMVPFPVDAGCGVPRVPAETLRFLRMEKPVVQQPGS